MRSKLLPAMACALAAGFAGCKKPAGAQLLDAGSAFPTSQLSADEIASPEQFKAMATPGGGLVAGGDTVKFFIDVKHGNHVYFINAQYLEGGTTPDKAKLHFFFAKSQNLLKDLNEIDEAKLANKFNSVTYFTQDRSFYAGTIQTYKVGQDEAFTYGLQFYPQDIGENDTIVRALNEVLKHFKLCGASPCAFVATGTQQKTDKIPSTMKNGARYLTLADGKELGDLSVEKILGNINYMPLNAGEAIGCLRLVPDAGLKTVPAGQPDPDCADPLTSGEDLTFEDIPIFNTLPLDLTVVAGVMTVAFQDVSCHINLKSKERHTPDMVLHKALTDPRVMGNLNKLIRLKVTPDGYTITSDAEEHGAIHAQLLANRVAQGKKVWVPLQSDVNEQRLLSYDEMCKDDPSICLGFGKKFGAKAANLGFLASSWVLGRQGDTFTPLENGKPVIVKDAQGNDMQLKNLPTLSSSIKYDLSPRGFGIPLWFYNQLIAANPELSEAIKALVASEKTPDPSLSVRQLREARVKQIDKVQGLFYLAKVPDELMKRLEDRARDLRVEFEKANPGVVMKKIKLRSSANAEDIPNFDGAGLHDSYGAYPADAIQNHKKTAAKIQKQLAGLKSVHPELANNPDACYRGSDPSDVDTSDGDASVADAQTAAANASETKSTMIPETFACALKGTYASLWNKRAVEERGFARLDPEGAAMGIAVLPSYKTEGTIVANSVVVTRVINSPDVYGYTMSIQKDNNLVTNPDKDTIAELTIANDTGGGQPPGFTISRFAVPVANQPGLTTSVMENVFKDEKVANQMMVEMLRITQRVEMSYCVAKNQFVKSLPEDARHPYYEGPNGCGYVQYDPKKPKSLDFEFKLVKVDQSAGSAVDQNFHWIAKQVREFSGK
jgi:hypothetical protein